MSIVPQQVCRLCGEEKPLSEYYIGNGKHWKRCKACVSAKNKAEYRSNPEKRAALQEYSRNRYVPRPAPPKPVVTEKACTRCGVIKPISTGFRGVMRNGVIVWYRSWCRACDIRYAVEWKRKHRVLLARPRRPRWPRGRREDYDRAGYNARKSKNSKLYRQRHPEKFIKGPNLVASHKSRAKAAGAEGVFTLQEWDALLAMYGNKCVCCGTAERITVDHVKSMLKGGSNYIENIQPLCWKCNNFKRARTIDYRNPPFSRV